MYNDNLLKISNVEEDISPIIRPIKRESFITKRISHKTNNSIEETCEIEYDKNIMDNLEMISRSENANKKKINSMRYEVESCVLCEASASLIAKKITKNTLEI